MSPFARRLRPLRLVLPATAVALVAVAWTTLHSQSTVISACAANRTGDIRLAVGGCDPRRETPITWNAQGPPGPAGPEGPAGPAGPESSIVTTGVPVGPVRVVREGTGCGSDTVVDERLFTVTLPAGYYRVTPLVSEVTQVNDATGQSKTSIDFNHAITGERVAISYWRIMSKDPDQMLALNSSTFMLTEVTPIAVRMRAEQRGCGHAEMAGFLHFDRLTLVPPVALGG